MNSMLHRREPSAFPAAIVVGGELNALGVCRSLAPSGVPTYVIDRKRLNAAMWCRYANPVPVRALHGAALVEALRSLQRRTGGRPVLVVTDEMALLTISEHRDALKPLFRFGLPPHGTVMMLHDKARFHEFALANDFPVPNGEVLRDGTQIGRIRNLRLPLVIKLADKRFFHFGEAPRLVVADNWTEAAAICDRLLAITGEIIVQECVDGPDTSLFFCLFYRGREGATTMFIGRKLASWPPRAGSTAVCTHAADIGGALERTTRAFIERVGYVGFGSLEYKWDAVTGRFLIIEPTVGRTDWQEEISTLSGVNIVLSGYCQECGLPPIEPTPAATRVVWQASYTDRLKVGAEATSPGAVVVDGYWRRDDPLPAIVHYPRDLFVSAPAVLGAWSGRLAHRLGKYVSRLSETIRPA